MAATAPTSSPASNPANGWWLHVGNLGVRLVHWDYHDQLRAAEGYDGHIPHVRALLKDVANLIASLQPDAIITWGPDGGSNHMDHRLIGDTVTGVYLSRDWGKAIGLYYYGTPVSQIDDEEARTRSGVLDRYLTTAVSYTPADFDAAAAALRCHASQFTETDMNSMIERRKERGPTIYLRKFAVPREHNDTVFQD
jgi:LmbE family N-acetylglucosaminyl deacetylase